MPGKEAMKLCLFISLLAQRNEPKKGHPVSLVPPKAGCPEFMPRMGYSSMLPGLCKLGFASNSANPLFGSLCGARLRANGIFLSPFVLPPSQTGAEKDAKTV
jgi:hypothetical protein